MRTLKILTDKDTTIRSNCGIYLIEEIIRKKKLHAFLGNLFKDRPIQAVYSDTDLLLGLTYAIICGGEYLEDVNEVKRQLDCEYLTIPSSDTMGYRMEQLSIQDEVVSNPKTQVNHYFNYNPELNRILIALGAWLNPDWKRTPVMIDYDNSIIYTGRDSQLTYKKGPGYQPGIGMIDNQPIYVEGRNGNSNSSFRMEETLERMAIQLEEAGVKIGSIRIDTAAFNKNVFQWLADRPSIKYYIGARKQGIPFDRKTKWKKFTLGELQTQATSLEYRTPGEFPCRLVAYRQKTEGQQDLFWGNYTYRFILTNDWQMDEEQIVRHYCMRGSAERTIEYMKYDFNWNHMPFGKMNLNTTYLLITAMSYLIYRWILKKIKYFKGITPSIRPKKLLLLFINVAGKWVQSGRTQYLKLYTCRAYEKLLRSG